MTGRARRPLRLELGAPVRASDAPFGELADVVVDPVRLRVTHLVVQPRRRHALARLVPIEWVATGSDPPEVALGATVEEIRDLEPIWQYSYLRFDEPVAEDPGWTLGIASVTAPRLDDGWSELDPDRRVSVLYDRVPTGEIELRRSSRITSSDGRHVGHVNGVFVDGDDRLTSLLLRRRRLWRTHELAVPAWTIADARSDAVRLLLTRGELERRRAHRAA